MPNIRLKIYDGLNCGAHQSVTGVPCFNFILPINVISSLTNGNILDNMAFHKNAFTGGKIILSVSN